MKVLIVEDEKALRQNIRFYLDSEGFTCEVARNFSEGEEKLEAFDYDCVLIDLGLPDGLGFDLIKRLKELKRPEGIIIISARDALDDKIKGLELGADDYLMKPFHLAELNARIKSVVRRRHFEGSNLIEAGRLCFDLEAKTVQVDQAEISLTRTELQLLQYMLANQNRVLPKDAIAEHIYGNDIAAADSFDFLYSHIKNLKKKLNQAGVGNYIRSVYGIGYKFEASE